MEFKSCRLQLCPSLDLWAGKQLCVSVRAAEMDVGWWGAWNATSQRPEGAVLLCVVAEHCLEFLCGDLEGCRVPSVLLKTNERFWGRIFAGSVECIFKIWISQLLQNIWVHSESYSATKQQCFLSSQFPWRCRSWLQVLKYTFSGFLVGRGYDLLTAARQLSQGEEGFFCILKDCREYAAVISSLSPEPPFFSPSFSCFFCVPCSLSIYFSYIFALKRPPKVALPWYSLPGLPWNETIFSLCSEVCGSNTLPFAHLMGWEPLYP